jgi:hypothetical protein
MALRDKLNTEHSGGKDGGGFWGKRVEAKETSDHVRRVHDKITADKGYDEYLENEERDSDEEFVLRADD